MDQDLALAQFLSATDCQDQYQAYSLLEKHRWNVDAAMDDYYESQSPAHPIPPPQQQQPPTARPEPSSSRTRAPDIDYEDPGFHFSEHHHQPSLMAGMSPEDMLMRQVQQMHEMTRIASSFGVPMTTSSSSTRFSPFGAASSFSTSTATSSFPSSTRGNVDNVPRREVHIEEISDDDDNNEDVDMSDGENVGRRGRDFHDTEGVDRDIIDATIKESLKVKTREELEDEELREAMEASKAVFEAENKSKAARRISPTNIGRSSSSSSSSSRQQPQPSQPKFYTAEPESSSSSDSPSSTPTSSSPTSSHRHQHRQQPQPQQPRRAPAATAPAAASSFERDESFIDVEEQLLSAAVAESLQQHLQQQAPIVDEVDSDSSDDDDTEGIMYGRTKEQRRARVIKGTAASSSLRRRNEYQSTAAAAASVPSPVQRDRVLRQEQDRAYEESLKADREMDRIKQEMEEIDKAVEREEERRKLEEERQRINHETEAKALWDSKKLRLTAEPAEGSPGTVQLLVRMEDGSRISRRFAYDTATVGMLYDWVDTSKSFEDMLQMGRYDLVTNIPRKVYNDKNMTLQEAGLHQPQMLLVQKAE